MSTASMTVRGKSLEKICEAADIRRIRLPMGSVNDDLDHVNAWLFLGEPGSEALVDTGSNASHNWGLLLAELNGLGAPIDVYCTHGHTDHAGHAAALARNWGIRLHMTLPEWSWAKRRLGRQGAALKESRSRFLKLMGIATNMRRSTSSDADLKMRDALDLPDLDHELRDGDRVDFGNREWLVKAGGGHSPLAACFFDRQGRFLITGDQVLPEMTPFVGVDWERPEAEPISEAIAFLKSLRDVPDDVLGLPGHGRPFHAVGLRASAHITSYLTRAERGHKAATRPQTCAALVPAMFRGDMNGPERDVMLTMAAAILNYLVAEGRMERWVGDDGMYRYRSC